MRLRVLHPRIIEQFEHDAKFQAKVHLVGTYYWLVSLPAIIYLFVFQAGLWQKYGLFITLLYSLYANFATDYGALSAAQASQKADAPRADIDVGRDLNVKTITTFKL